MRRDEAQKKPRAGRPLPQSSETPPAIVLGNRPRSAHRWMPTMRRHEVFTVIFLGVAVGSRLIVSVSTPFSYFAST